MRDNSKPPGPLTLLLRKTRVQARIEGLDPRGWSEDDYAVVDGETRVGRIYKEIIHGGPKWRWFLQTMPAPPPNQGMADTLDEAKAGIQTALCRGQGQVVTGPDLTPLIARELYAALERLGADAELLAIVGSWRDTLDDAEVLAMLREYNATGKALHTPQ